MQTFLKKILIGMYTLHFYGSNYIQLSDWCTLKSMLAVSIIK